MPIRLYASAFGRPREAPLRWASRVGAGGLACLLVLAGLIGAGCSSRVKGGAGPAAIRYGLDRPLASAPSPDALWDVPDSVSARDERWTLYSLGLQEEFAGRFELALGHYERASIRSPGDPELLVRRAVCHRELRRQEEALALAEQALAGDSLHIEALWVAATGQAALGRLEEALATASRLVRQGPEPRAHRLRANVLVRLGRHEEALAELDILIELDPDSPHLLEQRAELRMKLGRVDDALADYWTILTRAPDYPGIVDTLVAALGRLGRSDDLIRLFRTLADRNPEQARPRWRLVELLLARADWTEAEQELKRLHELRPGDGLPVLQLGLVAFRRGDAPRALELIEQARVLGSDPLQVWAWRMRIHFAEREYPEALAAADTLIVLDPRKSEGWRIRSLCLADTGRYDEALQSIGTWAALDDASAEPLMLAIRTAAAIAT